MTKDLGQASPPRAGSKAEIYLSTTAPKISLVLFFPLMRIKKWEFVRFCNDSLFVPPSLALRTPALARLQVRALGAIREMATICQQRLAIGDSEVEPLACLD
jgi:hypothetical protein